MEAYLFLVRMDGYGLWLASCHGMNHNNTRGADGPVKRDMTYVEEEMSMLVVAGNSILSEGWEAIPRHFVCQIERSVRATIENHFGHG